MVICRLCGRITMPREGARIGFDGANSTVAGDDARRRGRCRSRRSFTVRSADSSPVSVPPTVGALCRRKSCGVEAAAVAIGSDRPWGGVPLLLVVLVLVLVLVCT